MATNNTPESRSKILREEGNRFYFSVKDGVAPVLKQSFLEKALYKYNQAVNAAKDNDEKASALKNAAFASSKLAMLVVLDQEFQLLTYYLRNTSEYFSQSWKYGESVKPPQWKEALIILVQAQFVAIEDMAANLSFAKKLSMMEAYVYSLDIDPVRAELCVKIAELCFHESVYRIDEKDFKGCLGRLYDSNRPIEEALKCKSKDSTASADIAVIKDDVKYHLCRAESMQALHIGDELMAKYCKEGTVTDDDQMAWDILDWYKKAVLLTRELEVEIEAIALSRIGKFYDAVFKIKSRAREAFTAAISLALSLHPRTFDNDDWFKLCKETLERYQKEQVQQESDLWTNERKKYIAELEDELEELSENSKKSDNDLLQWVYKKHPPKKKGHTLPRKLPKVGKKDYNAEMKAVLKKAVVHYHPDRSEPEVNGMKWKVFCEEVCKLLTARYESFKLP